MEDNKELDNFLEDLRVGDIILELENLKFISSNEQLTETEQAGAVLIALAESYDQERLIKALRNDDSELLYEVLSEELIEAEETENELIRARFKACSDEKLVEKTVELIHSLGAYNVRMALELTDDEDLEEMEKEEMEKINKFLNKLEELKKEPLTKNENSGIILLILMYANELPHLVEVLEEDNLEFLNDLLKDIIDKIKDKEVCRDRYKDSEVIIKETVELIDKLGKENIKHTMWDILEDLYVNEDRLFEKE